MPAHSVSAPRLLATRLQHRAQIVMSFEIGWIFLHVVPRHGFLQNSSRITASAGLAARQYLQPQMRHFVARAISSDHSLRRNIRIANIFVGIVIAITHGHNRSRWQFHRCLITKNRLPVQVPRRNMNQIPLCSVRKFRKGLQICSNIMRVRIYRQKLDVFGHGEFVGHQKIFFTGRYIQFLIVFQLQQHRKTCRGMVGKIQPQAWLDPFLLSGRL